MNYVINVAVPVFFVLCTVLKLMLLENCFIAEI